jgi:YbbR domain-containing protein
MKRNLSRRLVRDWRLKLVSLLLALVLWLLLVPSEKIYSEKALTIPLETSNVPAGLEIVERQTSTIDITIRAPNRLLGEIGPSGLVGRVDLDRATVLQQEYPLDKTMIAVPPGAEVVKIAPNKVTIKLERTGEASLDVHPTLRGKPDPGFRIARTEIEPASVRVRGPESRLRAEEAATTAPVDVSGLAESTVFEADIILPRPELRLVSPPTRSRVTVQIEPVKGAAKAPAVKKRPG